MANAFTDTSGSSLGTSLVQAAYDRYVELKLRGVPMFDAFADKHPVAQAMPGSSVVLQVMPMLSEVSSTLTETVDPDAVLFGNTTPVTLTFGEYGNSAITTDRLQIFNLAQGGVNPLIANEIASNMMLSLDGVAQTAFRAGTNTVREISAAMSFAGSTATVTASDTAKARDFLAAVTKLRGNFASPNAGSSYFTAILHPNVAYDLRLQAGQGAWLTPNEYGSNQQRVWDGEMGTFGGALFIENARCYKATDGASSATVYRSYVFGQQAFASAYASRPEVVIGPVVDKLRRFQPIGWKGTLAYGIFRQEALFRVETSATF